VTTKKQPRGTDRYFAIYSGIGPHSAISRASSRSGPRHHRREGRHHLPTLSDSRMGTTPCPCYAIPSYETKREENDRSVQHRASRPRLAMRDFRNNAYAALHLIGDGRRTILHLNLGLAPHLNPAIHPSPHDHRPNCDVLAGRCPAKCLALDFRWQSGYSGCCRTGWILYVRVGRPSLRLNAGNTLHFQEQRNLK